MFQYEELNKQFIGGKWREGAGSSLLEDKNPYTQKISHHSVKQIRMT